MDEARVTRRARLRVRHTRHRGARGWGEPPRRRDPVTGPNPVSSTMHSTYDFPYVQPDARSRKRDHVVKFRCERDVLVEALGTAGRAVSSRGGALPVLVRGAGRAARRPPRAHRLRPRPDHLGPGGGDRRGGRRRRRAGAAGDRHRPVPRARYGSTSWSVSDEARITAGRSQFAIRVLPAEEFPRLAEPPADAVTLDAGEFAAALRQVVPAASADDARPDPHRRAAGRGGGRPAAGGDRLVPAGPARPARSIGAGRGADGAGAVAGAVRAGPAARPEGVAGAPPRRARGVLRGRRRCRAARDPADRGRVPALPGADPVELPQPA